MRILLDMNLPPSWVPVFESMDIEAHHWSTIGEVGAPDRIILEWACDNRCVVFTHDLDFGALLAASQKKTPSVLQVRTRDITPRAIKGIIAEALMKFREQLEQGALVTVDEKNARVRVLPMS